MAVKVDESDSDSELSSSDDCLDAACQWTENDSKHMPSKPPLFPFTTVPNIVPQFENEEGIFLQYFEHFFNGEIIDIICNETNRYAENGFTL